jgi:hypothetical protein
MDMLVIFLSALDVGLAVTLFAANRADRASRDFLRDYSSEDPD